VVNLNVSGLNIFELRIPGEEFVELDEQVRFMLALGTARHSINKQVLDTESKRGNFIHRVMSWGQEEWFSPTEFHRVMREAEAAGRILTTDDGLDVTEAGIDFLKENEVLSLHKPVTYAITED
jgi:hypothetical protein